MFKNLLNNKPDYDTVVARLYGEDWNGVLKGMLRRTIVGTTDSPKLLLSYGNFNNGKYKPFYPKDLIGLNTEELHDRAIENMLKQEYTVFSKKLKHGEMFGIRTNYFAPEIILNPDMLGNLRRALSVNNYLVSICIRTNILAIPKNENQKDLLNEFLQIHKDTYNNSSEKVFKHLLEFEGDTLKGVHDMHNLFNA